LTIFKEIQSSLQTCLSCLDTGVVQIDKIGKTCAATSVPSGDGLSSNLGGSSPVIEVKDSKGNVIIIQEKVDIAPVDEVFEAYIAARDNNQNSEEVDDLITNDEAKRNEANKKQSENVLKELKTVLVGKQKEWEVREARAIARQANIGFDQESEQNSEEKENTTVEARSHQVPISLYKDNISLKQKTESNLMSQENDVSPDSGIGNEIISNISSSSSEESMYCMITKIFKQDPETETPNHCVSLEKVEDEEDFGCISSSSLKLLGRPQLFRRPSRSAALRRSKKRNDMKGPQLKDTKVGECVYTQRQQQEIRFNSEPEGWNVSLATSVANRAKELRGGEGLKRRMEEIGVLGGEEYFGESDCDST